MASIETEMPCAFRAGPAWFKARLKDVSRVGARIQAPRGLARPGAAVAIEVALIDGKAYFQVEGRVVRVDPQQGGEDLYQLDFAGAPGGDEEAVQQFLASVLAGKGTGTRWHPRVYHRVGVECRGVGKFPATMINISRGGMALHCTAPLEKGSTLGVQLLMKGFPKRIDLLGTVANVREVREGVWQIGLKFRPLSPAAQAELEQIIRAALRGA